MVTWRRTVRDACLEPFSPSFVLRRAVEVSGNAVQGLERGNSSPFRCIGGLYRWCGPYGVRRDMSSWYWWVV